MKCTPSSVGTWSRMSTGNGRRLVSLGSSSNPDTGKGQRTQHFTGWTSMVVNMMSMPDLAEGASAGHDEL